MTVSNGIIRQRQPPPSQAPLWSEERIIHLTTLWSQGLSARQISRELGHGISRGSVLAKIYRLGIGNLSPRGCWRKSAGIHRPGGDRSDPDLAVQAARDASLGQQRGPLCR
jgi:hypothetical protein